MSLPCLLLLASLTATVLPAAVLPAVAQPQPVPTPFDYDPQAPLRLETRLTETVDEVDVHAIAYDSPRGGRVTGKLFVPRVAPGHLLAGVVMAHGAPGSTANMNPRAIHLARMGAVVIGIDAAFARRDPQAPITFTPRDADEQVQTIVDMRRAVDVLVARPDVDPSRLGFVGRSYGAAMGGILAGVERRIVAYALVVGDAGFVAHFTAKDGGWLPPLSELPAAQRDAWVAAMRPVSGEVHFPAADGRSLLLQNGLHDDAVLPHVARAFHALAPAGAEIRWYDGGHRLPPAHLADLYAFLHRRIGTAMPASE